jgi:SOS-response transcriptional repressor LexA
MPRRKRPSRWKPLQYANAERVYRFIETFVEKYQYPPTLTEVGEGCFMSRTTAMRYLDVLQAWGCLVRDAGVARGIALVGPLPPPPDETLDLKPSDPAG